MLYKCEIPKAARIGNRVTFNHNGLGVVVHPNSLIENDVYIEHHVCLGQRTGADTSAPIIRKNTVIGAYSVILGGVEIGKGCVIGACSLVLNDIPSHTIFYNERTIRTKENIKPIGKC